MLIVRRKAFPNAAAAGLSVLEYDDPKASEELTQLMDFVLIQTLSESYRMAIAKNPRRNRPANAETAAETFIAGAGQGQAAEKQHDANKVPTMIRIGTDLLERIGKGAKRLGISRSAFIVSSAAENWSGWNSLRMEKDRGAQPNRPNDGLTRPADIANMPAAAAVVPMETKNVHKLPKRDKSHFDNRQLNLFQALLCNTDAEQDTLSNAIDLWDSVPRYSVTRQAITKARISGQFLKKHTTTFQHRGRTYTAASLRPASPRSNATNAITTPAPPRSLSSTRCASWQLSSRRDTSTGPITAASSSSRSIPCGKR